METILHPRMGTNARLEVFIEYEIHGKADILTHFMLEGDEAEDIDVTIRSSVSTGPTSSALLTELSIQFVPLRRFSVQVSVFSEPVNI